MSATGDTAPAAWSRQYRVHHRQRHRDVDELRRHRDAVDGDGRGIDGTTLPGQCHRSPTWSEVPMTQPLSRIPLSKEEELTVGSMARWMRFMAVVGICGALFMLLRHG